jgi:hypothetical protein
MSYWMRGNIESPDDCVWPGSYSLRGLGIDYAGLLAQANLQNCNPFDSACVSNNAAKQAAVEDLWVSTYMQQPGGAPAGTQLTFTPQTATQVLEEYNPNPLQATNVIDTQGIMHVSGPAPVVPPKPSPVYTSQPAGAPVVIQQPVVTSPTSSPAGGGPSMPPGTALPTAVGPCAWYQARTPTDITCKADLMAILRAPGMYACETLAPKACLTMVGTGDAANIETGLGAVIWAGGAYLLWKLYKGGTGRGR